MGLNDCIKDAQKAGFIDKEEAQYVFDLHDEAVNRYGAEMGFGEAANFKAAKAVVEQIKAEKLNARRIKLLDHKMAVKKITELRQHIDHKGQQNPNEAAKMMFVSHGKEKSDIQSLDARYKSIRGLVHGMIPEFIRHHRRNLVGTNKDKAGMVDFVKEAFGEKTGNQNAASFAFGVGQSFEWMRLRWNAAGGNIGKLAKYGLPMSHDMLKVGDIGVDVWIGKVWHKLDRDSMIDGRTGKPFGDVALRSVLHDVHENIRTEGVMGSDGLRKGGSMAGRRSDHRFLHFKSADDWLAYHNDFGDGGTPFDIVNSYIDSMTRDLGLIETFGPNPDNMIMRIKHELDKTALLSKKTGKDKVGILDDLQRVFFGIDSLYEAYTGVNNIPVWNGLARFGQNTRQMLTAAMLGRAPMTALSDVGYTSLTAKFNGLSTAKILFQQLKLLNPRNENDRIIAGSLGLIMDDAAQTLSAGARYSGEVGGSEWAKKTADFVIRSTGLAAWTQAGKSAVGMEYLSHLALLSKNTFDELPKKLQKQMANYNIKPDHWEIIRETPLFEKNGGKFIKPADIGNRTDLPKGMADELMHKVLVMVQTETDFAIPSQTLKAEAIMKKGRPGTIGGEAGRSGWMYKGFTLSMFFTHYERWVNLDGMDKAAYGAHLLIAPTIMAAVGLQLKDISKGRDPRPIDNKEFWGQALLQGGGLGIFGDFLTQDTSRYGRSFGTTTAGPVVGLASDVWGFAYGNAKKLGSGEEARVAKDLIDFGRKYSPVSSAWYISQAYQRMVIDQLEMMADPKAKKKFRKRVERRLIEQNQDMWWPEGETAPQDLPDFSNIVGN